MASEPVRVPLAHIIISCTAGHPERPFLWALTRQPGVQGKGRNGRIWADARDAPLTRTFLTGKRPPPRPAIVTRLDANDQPTDKNTDTVRRQFQFHCHRCGFNLTSRAEHIEPVLDDIADSGESELESGESFVTLQGLALRLQP